LGCYGVQLTHHGGERVEGGAGKGYEERLAVRQAGELVIVEDRELSRGKVEPLTGLADAVAYVKVGLAEFGRRKLC